MVHGDDDGLKVPPAIAPWQVVIVPMLREDDGDAALIDYCEGLRRQLAAAQALGEPVRVLLDRKPGKAAAKRWDWVRKGAPLIVEVGGRDMADGTVSLLRRDALWGDNGKPAFTAPSLDEAARRDTRRCSRRCRANCSPPPRADRDARIARNVDRLRRRSKRISPKG